MTDRPSAPHRTSRAAVPMAVLLILTLGLIQSALAQTEGKAALDAFVQWKRAPGNSELGFGDALTKYREKLTKDSLPKETADRIINLITAYDEAELYNKVYAAPPEFNTRPNQLLVDATEGLRPGQALDVGMGQGRNSLYLAGKGWTVTGFDVAEVGLQKARDQAAAQGVTITAVHASDEEFDFGHDRWDLLAIIYAIEKRSVHRVRDALKPGGIVVVEAGHTETSGAIFEYRSNELLESSRASASSSTRNKRDVRLGARANSARASRGTKALLTGDRACRVLHPRTVHFPVSMVRALLSSMAAAAKQP